MKCSLCRTNDALNGEATCQTCTTTVVAARAEANKEKFTPEPATVNLSEWRKESAQRPLVKLRKDA